MWRVTLATPYWQEYLAREGGGDLRLRFLRLVLLHPSRSVQALFHFFPEATRCLSWEQVADVVFGELLQPMAP
ncbi:hypothetical protein ATCC90586_007000 [Pythium insidiosum]|nr:hypothetical protein ATCC90586_007000 [Pythium insidiosum]